MLPRTLLGLLAALWLTLGLPAVAKTPTRFPGTDWVIDLPAGFSLVTAPVTVFRSPAGAIIVVTQFPPGPPPEKDAQVGDIAGTGKNRARLDVVEYIDSPGRIAFYAEGYMLERKALMITFMVNTPTSSVVAVGSVPDAARGATDIDALRSALRGITEFAADPADRLEGFPLALPDMPDTRLVGVVLGATATWTNGPLDDARATADQRFLTVAAVAMPGDAQLDRIRRQGAENELVSEVLARNREARILSRTVESHAGGMHTVIRYTWRHDTGATVGGLALMRVLGTYMVMFQAQHPLGDTAAPDDVLRIFRAVTLRR